MKFDPQPEEQHRLTVYESRVLRDILGP